MSDYKIVSNDLTDRFSDMLRRLQDDYEDEIVAISLMNYYEICDDDEDLLLAIDRVLQCYMAPTDYLRWSKAKSLSRLAKIDQEDGLL